VDEVTIGAGVVAVVVVVVADVTTYEDDGDEDCRSADVVVEDADMNCARGDGVL